MNNSRRTTDYGLSIRMHIAQYLKELVAGIKHNFRCVAMTNAGSFTFKWSSSTRDELTVTRRLHVLNGRRCSVPAPLSLDGNHKSKVD